MNKLHLLRYASLAAALTFALLSGGCKMSVDHEAQKDKVDIRTPFGDLKVNTDVDARDTGLTIYPGSQPVQDSDSGDDHGAKVNISSNLFGVKVIVKEFRTSDSPEKVRSFYYNDLRRYGSVLECRGSYDQNVHTSKETDAPVTCDNDDKNGDQLQLKVGTQSKQHVVGIKPDGTGTRFALIYFKIRGKNEGI